jgi:nucleoid DNA-binding protein
MNSNAKPTFKEITSLVSEECGCSPDQAKEVILTFFDVLGLNVLNNGTVTLYGIGKFHSKRIKLIQNLPHLKHRPLTNSHKLSIQFKPARRYLDRLES